MNMRHLRQNHTWTIWYILTIFILFHLKPFSVQTIKYVFCSFFNWFSQPRHPTDGEVVFKWRFHFTSDKNVACHWLWHTKSVQYQPITVEENMSPVVLYIRYQRSCILYRDQYWGQYICRGVRSWTGLVAISVKKIFRKNFVKK